MGASQHGNHSQWKTEGNMDCLGSSPRKIGSKWIVNLRSSKLDRNNNDDEDKDGTWDELAETTFNMYLKSLFDAWDEEHGNENEYDGCKERQSPSILVAQRDNVLVPLTKGGKSNKKERIWERCVRTK
ncbi:hypothetical protein V8E54_003292 [Elaphomyces granulatus]